MTEVSCLYIHYNRVPKIITFIKYDEFFYKVIINNKSIIISNNTLLNIPHLFEYYLLSVLSTENTNQVIKIDNKYHISVKWYWKRLYFLGYYKNVELSKNNHRNPLNSKKPTRESSNKKINKFFKYYHRELLCTIDNIERTLNLYLSPELYLIQSEIVMLNEKIKIDKYVDILTSVKKYYGKDIYDSIRVNL